VQPAFRRGGQLSMQAPVLLQFYPWDLVRHFPVPAFSSHSFVLVRGRSYSIVWCRLIAKPTRRVFYNAVFIGADVNAVNVEGNTCLHLILRLIAEGNAGKHSLVDVFNTVHIPLVW